MPRIEISISGGAWQTGGVTATTGQSVALRLDSTVGVTSATFEVYGYHEDFAVPVGWTDTGSGGMRATTSGTSPPSFTVPAWGKWLVRVYVNGATEATDDTSGVRVLSPNGLEDIAVGEKNQFDAIRNWVGAWKRDLRIIDGAIAAPSSGSGVSVPIDSRHVYVWDLDDDAGTTTFSNRGSGPALALSLAGQVTMGSSTTMGQAALVSSNAPTQYGVVRAGDPVGVDLTALSSTFTAEMLVKHSASGVASILGISDSSAHGGFFAAVGTDRIIFGVTDPAGVGAPMLAYNPIGTIASTTNTWHHLMVVYSGGNWTLYFDGTQMFSLPSYAPDFTGVMILAGLDETKFDEFGAAGTAHIRNIRISNVARNAGYAQYVLSLASGVPYTGSIPATGAPPPPPGPVTYVWRFGGRLTDFYQGTEITNEQVSLVPYAYNTGTSAWATMPAMPFGSTHSSGSCIHGGEAYIVGIVTSNSSWSYRIQKFNGTAYTSFGIVPMDSSADIPHGHWGAAASILGVMYGLADQQIEAVGSSVACRILGISGAAIVVTGTLPAIDIFGFSNVTLGQGGDVIVPNECLTTAGQGSGTHSSSFIIRAKGAAWKYYKANPTTATLTANFTFTNPATQDIGVFGTPLPSDSDNNTYVFAYERSTYDTCARKVSFDTSTETQMAGGGGSKYLAAAAKYGTKYNVSGGGSVNALTFSAKEYAPGTDTWTSIPSMPIEVSGGTAVSISI